jgi:nitrogen fixation protein FixH
MSTATSFRFTGWHFLACMVVFFGIDIAVNVAFIVRAVQTFPGEVADDPYEAGVAYDQTLAQEAIEQKLGWMAVINDAGHAPQGEAISVHWTDRAGRPLSGLTVTGLLRRPATEQENTPVRFRETAPGAYRTVAAVPSGAWDLDVTAANRKGDKRTAERRLIWR